MFVGGIDYPSDEVLGLIVRKSSHRNISEAESLFRHGDLIFHRNTAGNWRSLHHPSQTHQAVQPILKYKRMETIGLYQVWIIIEIL